MILKDLSSILRRHVKGSIFIFLVTLVLVWGSGFFLIKPVFETSALYHLGVYMPLTNLNARIPFQDGVMISGKLISMKSADGAWVSNVSYVKKNSDRIIKIVVRGYKKESAETFLKELTDGLLKKDEELYSKFEELSKDFIAKKNATALEDPFQYALRMSSLFLEHSRVVQVSAPKDLSCFWLKGMVVVGLVLAFLLALGYALAKEAFKKPL